MALLFHSNIQNLFTGRGVYDGLAHPTAISIMKDTQPTTTLAISSWDGVYNAKILAHYESVEWTHPSNGVLLQLTPPLVGVPALQSGYAQWAIIWSTNVAEASLSATTIPSTNFMIVPVSLSDGSGVIRFDSVDFVNLIDTNIVDGSIGTVII